MAHFYITEDYQNGALFAGAYGDRNLGGNSRLYIRSVNLDASRSNSIYTDNGKVYPASLALNYIIKC